jgi:hypothetical protein
MSIIRKNTSRKRAKKNPPTVVLVTKTFHPVEETHFPEKVKKAKEILTKAGFRPF